MLGSIAIRRLLSSVVSHNRSAASPAFLRLSTATPQPSPPPNPFEQQQQTPQQDAPIPPSGSSSSSSSAAGAAGVDRESHRRRSTTRPRGGGDYEEEQTRVLRAALPYVVKLGWGESAMISGARDVGVSPSIVGSFPRKEAALVEFFMDDCLQRLIDKIDSGEELQNLILSDRLSRLIRIRLEMQAPYISKWPQALSIQAQPLNLPTSFKQRALLVDEIWHAVGDVGSDIDWYVKRTVLGGIYSTSEVYMVTDHSPEFCDTWTFMERRIKDVFDLQKTVQEAAYLAEAVGTGMGNSMQGFVKRIFQG